MWQTLRDWIHATEGIAVGTVLDVVLAVMLAVTVVGGMQFWIGAL